MRALRQAAAAALAMGVTTLTEAAMHDCRAEVAGRDAPPASTAPHIRIFYSGHSLTDLPIPADVASIAQSLGRRVAWNRQHIGGSTIEQRAMGLTRAAPEGRRHAGVDRHGRPIDVMGEFETPSVGDGRPYDALVITEQHALLAALLWNDTMGRLALFQDRFAERSPHGATWFYESWMSLDDKSDPAAWIAYERAAAPMWRCVAAGVNRSLAARGRSDRIASLPAASALAGLIAAAPDGVLPGARTPAEAVALMISDEVHLTRLGSYFMALVIHTALEGGDMEGAWAPTGVSADQALALQRFAAAFMAREKARDADPGRHLDACAKTLETSFMTTFWTYFARARWRSEFGAFGARARLVKEIARGKMRRWRGSDNPFLIASEQPQGEL